MYPPDHFLPLLRERWRRFSSWFKLFQKRWNDWPLVGGGILLFLAVPYWIRRYLDPEAQAFPADYLNVLPSALLYFLYASAVAYTMFRIQFPDLFADFIRCLEDDLLRAPEEGIYQLNKEYYDRKNAHAWHLFKVSLAILFSYFFGTLLLEIAVLVIS